MNEMKESIYHLPISLIMRDKDYLSRLWTDVELDLWRGIALDLLLKLRQAGLGITSYDTVALTIMSSGTAEEFKSQCKVLVKCLDTQAESELEISF